MCTKENHLENLVSSVKGKFSHFPLLSRFTNFLPFFLLQGRGKEEASLVYLY